MLRTDSPPYSRRFPSTAPAHSALRLPKTSRACSERLLSSRAIEPVPVRSSQVMLAIAATEAAPTTIMLQGLPSMVPMLPPTSTTKAYWPEMVGVALSRICPRLQGEYCTGTLGRGGPGGQLETFKQRVFSCKPVRGSNVKKQKWDEDDSRRGGGEEERRRGEGERRCAGGRGAGA
eukprot:193381-Hanusia_phi.AAC.2